MCTECRNGAYPTGFFQDPWIRRTFGLAASDLPPKTSPPSISLLCSPLALTEPCFLTVAALSPAPAARTPTSCGDGLPMMVISLKSRPFRVWGTNIPLHLKSTTTLCVIGKMQQGLMSPGRCHTIRTSCPGSCTGRNDAAARLSSLGCRTENGPRRSVLDPRQVLDQRLLRLDVVAAENRDLLHHRRAAAVYAGNLRDA